MDFEPYLFFSGNCEEALNFYKDIFGGDVKQLSRWKDAPSDMGMPPNSGDKIMHASFVSPSIKFMCADARPTTQYGEGRISLSIGTTDADEAKRVFERLGKGGKIEMQLEKTFWGALFGMLTDKYGIDWMVNCQLEPMPA